MSPLVSFPDASRPADLLRELDRRNRILAVTGWLHLALAAVLLAVLPFDSRLVMGINPWIKPIKFAISITIYVWTIAWYLGYLHLPGWRKKALARGIAISMIAEIICIAVQAARGTTSHYNIRTPLDAAIFSTMGTMIAINTVIALVVLICFFVQQCEIPRPYLVGIRSGLTIFLMASAVGGVMIHQKAHSVGVGDGGPGLPLLNWSTQGGDLRAAHFLGLHALQVIPIFGFLISRQKRWTAASKTKLVLLFAASYAALFAFLYFQALRGLPILRI